MTDVEVATAEGGEPLPDLEIEITLPGEIKVKVNVTKLGDEVYQAVVAAGLETIFRKANGIAKSIAGITKATGEDLVKRQKAIAEAAEKTLKQLTDGQVPGKRAAKATGEERLVHVEAMRLAKIIVKDRIRAEGHRQNAYTAKQITDGCKTVLQRLPHLFDLARKNLAERATETKSADGVNLKALFGAIADDPSKKAKPKKAPPPPKKKGEPKEPLSAKQAGMVAPKAKPQGATAH